MAFLRNRTSFPSYEQSRNYFQTGIGGPPQVDNPDEDTQIAASGGGTGVASTAEAAAPAPPAAPPATAPPAAPPVTGAAGTQVYTPPTLGYGTPGTQGPLTQRLFQPVQQAAQAGQADVVKFADLFRQEAGPSRTYGGIGAESTLAGAVEGGPLDPARELVGAQYQGPAGLDPNVVGGLQFLGGQLEQRQRNLGTGAGVTSAIGQTVQTLTPGETRFEAERLFTPEFRASLPGALAPVGEFTGALEQETAGAQAFAGQRQEEEADIAKRAAEYLTGRRAGISEDIAGQIEAGQAQQLQAQGLWGDITGAEDTGATIEALRKAQEAGLVGPGANLGALDTEAQQATRAGETQRQEIMEKFPTVSQFELGVPGVGKRGKPSPFVRDAQGNLRDYREVIPEELRGDWTKRQAELEEVFNPLRQPWMQGQESTLQQQVNPLYYGTQDPGAAAFAGQFQGPQLTDQQKEYLKFDPGFKPSRGNVSSEQQRGQFNRINDLLGDLDRISSEESPFRAASLAVNVEKYLEDENTALEAQVATLDQRGKEWLNQVRGLRKKYKKAKKKEAWGKIASVAGGVVGAVVGGVVGGPAGAVAGTGFGANIGRSLA